MMSELKSFDVFMRISGEEVWMQRQLDCSPSFSLMGIVYDRDTTQTGCHPGSYQEKSLVRAPSGPVLNSPV
ncbi:hypothetical protein K443DRAFT_679669, partial [Laccaria amethystina LaAM-08-1]